MAIVIGMAIGAALIGFVLPGVIRWGIRRGGDAPRGPGGA